MRILNDRDYQGLRVARFLGHWFLFGFQSAAAAAFFSQPSWKFDAIDRSSRATSRTLSRIQSAFVPSFTFGRGRKRSQDIVIFSAAFSKRGIRVSGFKDLRLYLCIMIVWALCCRERTDTRSFYVFLFFLMHFPVSVLCPGNVIRAKTLRLH